MNWLHCTQRLVEKLIPSKHYDMINILLYYKNTALSSDAFDYVESL